MPSFDEWFERATGNKPYPFQVRFAYEPELLSNPSPAGRGQGEGLLVDVPTGLGKTAMAFMKSISQIGSLHLFYDAEGDILDVDFRLIGEKPRQGVELHDNVTVWTDAQGTRILRLMFLSYSRLLEQRDLPLVKLKKLPARQRAGLLKLLTSDPVKGFLVCVNQKELRFRVADPGVRAGAAA